MDVSGTESQISAGGGREEYEKAEVGRYKTKKQLLRHTILPIEFSEK